MFSMKIESVVAALVKQELIGKGRDDQALHFDFDLHLTHYDKDDSFSRRHGLHLLYHLNSGATYVSVFSAVTERFYTKVHEVKNWKHEVSHDSCWRDIQVFSKLYFEMAKQINEDLVNHGRAVVAPKDMHQHNCFELFGQAYNWVNVKVTRDSTDNYGYRRLIEVL